MKSKNALLRDEVEKANIYKFWLPTSPEVARKFSELTSSAFALCTVLIFFVLIVPPQVRPLLLGFLILPAGLGTIGLMCQSDLKTALRMKEDQCKIAEALAHGVRLTDPSEPKQVFMGDDGELVVSSNEDHS
jgi:hypothetical protein